MGKSISLESRVEINSDENKLILSKINDKKEYTHQEFILTHSGRLHYQSQNETEVDPSLPKQILIGKTKDGLVTVFEYKGSKYTEGSLVGTEKFNSFKIPYESSKKEESSKKKEKEVPVLTIPLGKTHYVSFNPEISIDVYKIKQAPIVNSDYKAEFQKHCKLS